MTFVAAYLAFNVTRANGIDFSHEELAAVVEQAIAKAFPKIALKKGGVVATIGPPIPDVTVVLQKVKCLPMEEPTNGKAHPMVAPLPTMNVKPIISPLPPAVSPSLPSAEPRLQIVP